MCAGITTPLFFGRDMDKSGGGQSARRTAAVAPLNAGWDLWCQAAGCGRPAVAGARINPCAQMVIKEYSPGSAGAVPDRDGCGARMCHRGFRAAPARLRKSPRAVPRGRPPASHGRFEVLFWSPWKERRASTGPFGRTVRSIDEAPQFIAHEDIFWVMT